MTNRNASAWAALLVALSVNLTAAAEHRVYVGSYTGGDSKAEGITQLRFDDASGALRVEGLAAQSESPSFLAVSADGRFVYSVGEPGGVVTAYAVEPASGWLRELNRLPVGDDQRQGPCHLCLVPGAKMLVTANYVGGSVSTFSLAPDGRLLARTGYIRHAGSGPNAQRQQAPHAHGAVLSPDGRHVLVNDLGTDRVQVYAVDAKGQTLKPEPVSAGVLAAGAGPRHGAFDPGGRVFHCLNELDSTLTPLVWDAAKGTLTAATSASTLPEGGHAGNSTAEVVVHPGGRWVLASNRGHDSIAVFEVTAGQPEKVTFRGAMPCGGRVPRNFTLSPDGRWVLVAHQESQTVQVFAFDAQSGALTAKGEPVAVGKPVCLVFVPAAKAP